MPELKVKLASRPDAQRTISYKNASVFGGRCSGRFRTAALGLISLLLGALIFAQTLGLMHPLVHGPHSQGAVHAPVHHSDGDDVGAHHGAGLKTLFASHEDGSDSCRVFDQQGHSVVITVVASLALPGVLRAALPPAGVPCDRVAVAAPFEARAPPSFR